MVVVVARGADDAATEGDGGDGPPTLTIELLGGFRVVLGERTIDESEWYLRKARSLVKLLALAENHRLHRGQITDLLWPELDPSAAGNNLHKALHVARRALEPDLPPKATSRFLQLNDDLVILDTTHVHIDVELFRDAAERAQTTQNLAAYQEAIALYQGDLLPEDRYEEWTIRSRDELRQLYLTLLLELAEVRAHQGESSDAIEVLRQVIALDHANEQAHVALMHLLASTGQRQAALRQYAVLRDALLQELGAEPDAAVQSLYSEILSGRYAPDQAVAPAVEEPQTSQPSSSLIGRDDALARMRARLDALFEGRGSVLFLQGEAGMGKSSLASVLEDEAVQRGAISLWGAAYIEDEELPYGPVARAIEGFALRVAGDTLRALADGFTAELACVAPAFRRIATRRGGEASVDLWDEQRMLQALIHFFRALSDHVPVVLALEDLHLANDRTIALLEHLARLLPDVQMLVLCTFRSDQVSVRSDLGRLAAGAGTNPEIEMVDVEPLHRSEIGALAARLLAAPIAGEVLDIIADIAQGSPYYVEEAVWGLRGRRRIEQVNGTWQVRRGIRVSWDRNDVRKLVDAAGDFQLARKLRSV